VADWALFAVGIEALAAEGVTTFDHDGVLKGIGAEKTSQMFLYL